MNLHGRIVFLSVALTVCLAFPSCGVRPATLSGAGSAGNTAPSPAATAPAIRIYLPGEEPLNGKAVLTEIEARTAGDVGCSLDVHYLPWSDYLAKIYMMSAASEKFDLFLCFSGELPKMIARNFLRPLDDLLERNGPDLVRVIPADEFDALKVDGRLYGIPSVYPRVEIAAHAIRRDLRLRHGIPEIDNLADFEQYLQAMKEEEGIIPYAADMGNLGGGLTRAFMDDHLDWYWGEDAIPYVQVDWTRNPMRVESSFSSALMQSALTWNRKAYRNGWFPKDILTMQKSRSLFVTGKAGVVPADLYNLQELAEKLRKNIPTGEVELVTFQKAETHTKIGPSNNFACLSMSGENPGASMRFLNWIRTSQENYDLYMYGRPGKEYEQTGETVRRLADSGDAKNWLYDPMPWLSRDFTYERVTTSDPAVYADALRYWKNLSYTVCPIGGFSVSNADFQMEQAQIITLIREQWLPIFVGYKSSDEDYRNFLKQLDDAGLPKIIAGVQDQLDAYLVSRKT